MLAVFRAHWTCAGKSIWLFLSILQLLLHGFGSILWRPQPHFCLCNSYSYIVYFTLMNYLIFLCFLNRLIIFRSQNSSSRVISELCDLILLIAEQSHVSNVEEEPQDTSLSGAGVAYSRGERDTMELLRPTSPSVSPKSSHKSTVSDPATSVYWLVSMVVNTELKPVTS